MIRNLQLRAGENGGFKGMVLCVVVKAVVGGCQEILAGIYRGWKSFGVADACPVSVCGVPRRF